MHHIIITAAVIAAAADHNARMIGDWCVGVKYFRRDAIFVIWILFNVELITPNWERINILIYTLALQAKLNAVRIKIKNKIYALSTRVHCSITKFVLHDARGNNAHNTHTHISHRTVISINTRYIYIFSWSATWQQLRKYCRRIVIHAARHRSRYFQSDRYSICATPRLEMTYLNSNKITCFAVISAKRSVRLHARSVLYAIHINKNKFITIHWCVCLVGIVLKQ